MSGVGEGMVGASKLKRAGVGSEGVVFAKAEL